MENFNKQNGSLFSNFIKRIATVVLFIFCFNILQDYSYSIEINISAKEFMLPLQYGKIVENYKGNDLLKNKKIFLIQDLHCDPYVQENIKNILKLIKTTYGKDFRVMGAEGTPVSNINTNIISFIPNKEYKEKLVRYFVGKGLISGLEWYSIMDKSVVLKGLENKDIYLNNFSNLYDSFYYRSEFKSVLNDLRYSYEKTKKFFYTKEVAELLEFSEKYRDRKINFEEYLQYLKKISIKYKVDFDFTYPNLSAVLSVKNMRDRLNLSIVSTETKYMLKQLDGFLTQKNIDTLSFLKDKNSEDYYLYLAKVLRENNIDISRNYRNVSDYFRYLETLKEIDDVKLLQEKERLEYRLKKEMLEKRGDSFDFLNSEYSLYLLDRYLNNKASKRDVESYENNVKLKNLQVFSNKLLRKDYFKGYESDLAKAEENMKQFYSVADKRNEVIINNLTGVDFQESNVIAVVIGGYHINGIKDYLKSKGISYEEVIPSVKEGNYKNYYEDRLFEQANWLNINNNRKTDIISIPEVSEQNLVSQKLQLISIFVDKSLISGNSQVEFLLSQDIMNLGQVLNKIKENESKFIAGNLSEVEKLSIAISLAYNYRELNEGIKSELLTTNLGLEIISIFEDSKIDNSSEQMFKDKNIDIYSEVRKNLKLNEDLSEKDKLVITNAIDQEEVYSKTSLIELNQKKYSFFSPVLKTLIGMILVGATVGIFFLFPALPILGLVALGLGALVGVGVLIWGISNIVKTKNIRKQIHSFKEIAAITGQADEELFEAEGIEKEGMARIFENAKKGVLALLPSLGFFNLESIVKSIERIDYSLVDKKTKNIVSGKQGKALVIRGTMEGDAIVEFMISKGFGTREKIYQEIFMHEILEIALNNEEAHNIALKNTGTFQKIVSEIFLVNNEKKIIDILNKEGNREDITVKELKAFTQEYKSKYLVDIKNSKALNEKISQKQLFQNTTKLFFGDNIPTTSEDLYDSDLKFTKEVMGAVFDTVEAKQSAKNLGSVSIFYQGLNNVIASGIRFISDIENEDERNKYEKALFEDIKDLISRGIINESFVWQSGIRTLNQYYTLEDFVNTENDNIVYPTEDTTNFNTLEARQKNILVENRSVSGKFSGLWAANFLCRYFSDKKDNVEQINQQLVRIQESTKQIKTIDEKSQKDFFKKELSLLLPIIKNNVRNLEIFDINTGKSISLSKQKNKQESENKQSETLKSNQQKEIVIGIRGCSNIEQQEIKIEGNLDRTEQNLQTEQPLQKEQLLQTEQTFYEQVENEKRGMSQILSQKYEKTNKTFKDSINTVDSKIINFLNKKVFEGLNVDTRELIEDLVKRKHIYRNSKEELRLPFNFDKKELKNFDLDEQFMSEKEKIFNILKDIHKKNDLYYLGAYAELEDYDSVLAYEMANIKYWASQDWDTYVKPENIEAIKSQGKNFKSSINNHVHVTDTHGNFNSLILPLLSQGVVKFKRNASSFVVYDFENGKTVELDKFSEIDKLTIDSKYAIIPNVELNTDFKGTFSFGGDFLDRGAFSKIQFALLDKLTREAKEQGKLDNFVVVLGNHELLKGREKGFSEDSAVFIDEILSKGVKEDRFKFCWTDGQTLISHSNLSVEDLNILMEYIKNNKNIYKKFNKQDQILIKKLRLDQELSSIDLKNLTNVINNFLKIVYDEISSNKDMSKLFYNPEVGNGLIARYSADYGRKLNVKNIKFIVGHDTVMGDNSNEALSENGNSKIVFDTNFLKTDIGNKFQDAAFFVRSNEQGEYEVINFRNLKAEELVKNFEEEERVFTSPEQKDSISAITGVTDQRLLEAEGREKEGISGIFENSKQAVLSLIDMDPLLSNILGLKEIVNNMKFKSYALVEKDNKNIVSTGQNNEVVIKSTVLGDAFIEFMISKGIFREEVYGSVMNHEILEIALNIAKVEGTHLIALEKTGTLQQIVNQIFLSDNYEQVIEILKENNISANVEELKGFVENYVAKNSEESRKNARLNSISKIKIQKLEDLDNINIQQLYDLMLSEWDIEKDGQYLTKKQIEDLILKAIKKKAPKLNVKNKIEEKMKYDLFIGKLNGEIYEVLPEDEGIIGQGAQGSVYMVKNVETGDFFAMKKIAIDGARMSIEARREEFLKLKVSFLVDKAKSVGTNDYGYKYDNETNYVYSIMPLVEGVDLENFILHKKDIRVDVDSLGNLENGEDIWKEVISKGLMDEQGNLLKKIEKIEDLGLDKKFDSQMNQIFNIFKQAQNQINEENRKQEEILKQYQKLRLGLPEIIVGVFEGLKDLYTKGFSHGDIKPGNIMIDKDGNVKLIDFDMAEDLKTNEFKELGTGGYKTSLRELRKVVTQENKKLEDSFAIGITILQLYGYNVEKQPNALKIKQILEKMKDENLELEILCEHLLVVEPNLKGIFTATEAWTIEKAMESEIYQKFFNQRLDSKKKLLEVLNANAKYGTNQERLESIKQKFVAVKVVSQKSIENITAQKLSITKNSKYKAIMNRNDFFEKDWEYLIDSVVQNDGKNKLIDLLNKAGKNKGMALTNFLDLMHQLDDIGNKNLGTIISSQDFDVYKFLAFLSYKNFSGDNITYFANLLKSNILDNKQSQNWVEFINLSVDNNNFYAFLKLVGTLSLNMKTKSILFLLINEFNTQGLKNFQQIISHPNFNVNNLGTLWGQEIFNQNVRFCFVNLLNSGNINSENLVKLIGGVVGSPNKKFVTEKDFQELNLDINQLLKDVMDKGYVEKVFDTISEEKFKKLNLEFSEIWQDLNANKYIDDNDNITFKFTKLKNIEDFKVSAKLEKFKKEIFDILQQHAQTDEYGNIKYKITSDFKNLTNISEMQISESFIEQKNAIFIILQNAYKAQEKRTANFIKLISELDKSNSISLLANFLNVSNNEAIENLVKDIIKYNFNSDEIKIKLESEIVQKIESKAGNKLERKTNKKVEVLRIISGIFIGIGITTLIIGFIVGNIFTGGFLSVFTILTTSVLGIVILSGFSLLGLGILLSIIDTIVSSNKKEKNIQNKESILEGKIKTELNLIIKNARFKNLEQKYKVFSFSMLKEIKDWEDLSLFDDSEKEKVRLELEKSRRNNRITKIIKELNRFEITIRKTLSGNEFVVYKNIIDLQRQYLSENSYFDHKINQMFEEETAETEIKGGIENNKLKQWFINLWNGYNEFFHKHSKGLIAFIIITKIAFIVFSLTNPFSASVMLGIMLAIEIPSLIIELTELYHIFREPRTTDSFAPKLKNGLTITGAVLATVAFLAIIEVIAISHIVDIFILPILAIAMGIWMIWHEYSRAKKLARTSEDFAYRLEQIGALKRKDTSYFNQYTNEVLMNNGYEFVQGFNFYKGKNTKEEREEVTKMLLEIFSVFKNDVVMIRELLKGFSDTDRLEFISLMDENNENILKIYTENNKRIVDKYYNNPTQLDLLAYSLTHRKENPLDNSFYDRVLSLKEQWIQLDQKIKFLDSIKSENYEQILSFVFEQNQLLADLDSISTEMLVLSQNKTFEEQLVMFEQNYTEKNPKKLEFRKNNKNLDKLLIYYFNLANNIINGQSLSARENVKLKNLEMQILRAFPDTVSPTSFLFYISLEFKKTMRLENIFIENGFRNSIVKQTILSEKIEQTEKIKQEQTIVQEPVIVQEQKEITQESEKDSEILNNEQVEIKPIFDEEGKEIKIYPLIETIKVNRKETLTDGQILQEYQLLEQQDEDYFEDLSKIDSNDFMPVLHSFEELNSALSSSVKLRGFDSNTGATMLDFFNMKKMTIDSLSEMAETLNILSLNMNDVLLEKEVKKNLGDSFHIRNWELEIVDSNVFDVQTKDFGLEAIDSKNGKVIVRMSKGLLLLLNKLEKVMDEEVYKNLIQEIFLHERIELFYKNINSDATSQQAHLFALEHSGDLQKGLVNIIEVLELFSKVDSNLELNRDDLGYLQDGIDKIKQSLGLTTREFYKMYPNIESVIINNVARSIYSDREIVIDINGKTIKNILEELGRLKLEEKSSLRVILVGEPRDLIYKEELTIFVDKLKILNNSVMKLEWVIGQNTLGMIKTNDKLLQDLYSNKQIKLTTNLSNGYILTATGVISDSLYNFLLKKNNKQSLTSIEVSDIINNEFYRNVDAGEILSLFFKSRVENASKDVKQILIGIGIELQGEAKEIAENIVNTRIRDNDKVKIADLTEEGIIIGAEMELSKVANMKDMLELEATKEEMISSVKVLGRKKVELDSFDTKKFRLTKIGLEIKIAVNKLFRNIGINKFIDIKDKQAVHLDTKLVGAIASAA